MLEQKCSSGEGKTALAAPLWRWEAQKGPKCLADLKFVALHQPLWALWESCFFVLNHCLFSSRWVCAVGSPAKYCKFDKTLDFKLFGEAGRNAQSLVRGSTWLSIPCPGIRTQFLPFPAGRSNFPLPVVKPVPESTFGPNWCKLLTLPCRKVNTKPKRDACGVSGTTPFKGNFFPSLLSHPRSNSSGGTVSLVVQAAIN